MSIRQKRYGTRIGRGLLLAGYLFLFVGQFSCQYFAIANFFVYGNNHSSGLGPSGHATQDRLAVNAGNTGEQHNSVLQANTERPAHLGIDKRYQFKQAIRVPQIRAPGLTVCIVLKSYVPHSVPDYISSELTTNSLRGPPCA
jgi:hypothetical protein